MRRQKPIQGRQGLQLNEQNLQILVETIPALMWRAKPDGHIDYVNKRLLEYFGSPLRRLLVREAALQPPSSSFRELDKSISWPQVANC
jgi:PAS domain-containing protein